MSYFADFDIATEACKPRDWKNEKFPPNVVAVVEEALESTDFDLKKFSTVQLCRKLLLDLGRFVFVEEDKFESALNEYFDSRGDDPDFKPVYEVCIIHATILQRVFLLAPPA